MGWVLGEKYFGCVVDMRRFHALCEWQIAAGRAEADALRQLVSEYEALGGWLDAAQKGQRMYQLAGEYQDYSRPLLDASLAG